MSKKWPKVRLGEVLGLDLDRVLIDVSMSYPMVGVLSFGRGLFDREPIENGNTSYKYFNRLKADHIVMSQLFGWEGRLRYARINLPANTSLPNSRHSFVKKQNWIGNFSGG